MSDTPEQQETPAEVHNENGPPTFQDLLFQQSYPNAEQPEPEPEPEPQEQTPEEQPPDGS